MVGIRKQAQCILKILLWWLTFDRLSICFLWRVWRFLSSTTHSTVTLDDELLGEKQPPGDGGNWLAGTTHAFNYEIKFFYDAFFLSACLSTSIGVLDTICLVNHNVPNSHFRRRTNGGKRATERRWELTIRDKAFFREIQFFCDGLFLPACVFACIGVVDTICLANHNALNSYSRRRTNGWKRATTRRWELTSWQNAFF